MVIGLTHLQPIVALDRRHSHPDHAAAAQLHRRDLSDRRRRDRAWTDHLAASRSDYPGLRRRCRAVLLGAVGSPSISWTHGSTKTSRVSAKVKKQAVPKASRSQGRRRPPRHRHKPAKGKWVYGFGGGKAEGKADMRNLLGGKGANLAEMANLGLPVPPGFTITTEVCTYYYANDKQYPKELTAQVEEALAAGRPDHRQDLRRQDQSAAGLGALGRARLDAGHDGHRAQSRPQRRDRRGAGEEIRRPRASPTTATGASSPCIPTWCSASSIIISRKCSTDHKERQGYRLDTDLTADDWAELVERYKKRVRGGARQAVSAGPARAAVGRDRRGVRFLDESARQHLSPPAQHSGKLGHRGQCAGHGVRQYGRDLARPASPSRAIRRPARRSSTANS